MERRYRRLLALYPKDHRREHAEEMVGVLLAVAAADDAQVRTPKPVAWALRFAEHTADSADLVAGALRIRGRMALNRIGRAGWFSRTARDQRWSDALAVVSVVAPLLLLVAALAEVHIPQAAASSVTGHPHWQLTAALGPTSVTMTYLLPLIGRPHRRRNLARPVPGHRASPPGGPQDHLRGTPGHPARLTPHSWWWWRRPPPSLAPPPPPL